MLMHQTGRHAAECGLQRSALHHRPSRQPCRVHAQAPASEACQRRSVLLRTGLAVLMTPTAAAWARELQYGNWDGSSAAYGSCPVGEDGRECRQKALSKERPDISSYGTSSFSRPEGSKAIEPSVKMADDYTKVTLQLSDGIESWARLDTYDPKRPKITQSLKKDTSDWASKYARGGSARKLSARKFYVAVDALQGHLVSQGMAPMPPPKLEALLKDVSSTKQLLAEAK